MSFDIAFSTFEWRWLKQIADVKPMTIGDAINDVEPGLFCAFAVIAMYRAGRITREEVLGAADVLADAPFDGARISLLGEEVDVDPPAMTSEPEQSSPRSSLDKPPTSGADSTNGSETLAETLEPTGTSR